MNKDKEPSIIKLLAFVYERYYRNTRFKWHIWAYIILLSLTKLYPLLISFLLGRIIDTSIYAIDNGDGFQSVVPLIILFGVIALIWTLVNNIFQYIDSTIDLWISYLDDEVYLNKYIEIEPKAYEDPSFVNQKGMLNWNSHRILHSFFQSLEILSLAPVVAISFWAIFTQIPLLAILAVIATIPTAIIIKKFGRKVWGIWSDRGDEKIKYSSYRSTLWSSHFEKLQEVYVFKYGRYLLEKAKKINERFINKFRKNYISRYSWSAVANFLSNIINIFVLIFSIQMVFEGSLTIGMLTFVISAYQRFNGDVSEVLYKVSAVLGDKKFFATFYNILNWKNTIASGKEDLENVESGLSVEFKNVWFKYPETRKWILKNVSFKVSKDEDIAIVGKNGAGKSTMIKLLLRVYDPQKGEIIVNGHNIKDLNLDEYYKLVGILSQSFNQLSITVEDNIFVGDVSKNMDGGVEIAAKNADIHDAIIQLPDKYKTFLSREVKGGIQLSGGQWQKLAIARAFFRNAKLLILDEPTSGVDSISEEKIFENIRNNAKDRTTIIVSHRFATVRKAKRIIVIDDGKIVEDGDHTTLLSNNGLYAQMYNKQVG
jgi:ATP-binding cassette subfamily B protein/ATP-binding cassette subfamily C protein